MWKFVFNGKTLYLPFEQNDAVIFFCDCFLIRNCEFFMSLFHVVW